MTRQMSFVAVSFLAGCLGSHTSPDRGEIECPCPQGWTCDVATNECVAGSGGSGAAPPPAPPMAYSPAVVQTALAQCSLAHGPVQPTPTNEAKRAVMLGAWVACPPSSATVYEPGIVFSADGAFNRLLSDGSGGLQMGYGVDNQGAYTFPYPDQQETSGNPYVTLATASNDFRPAYFADGPITFEMSPPRFHGIITYLDQTIEVWLVRLP